MCKLHRTFSLANIRVRFFGSRISWLPLPIRTYLPVVDYIYIQPIPSCRFIYSYSLRFSSFNPTFLFYYFSLTRSSLVNEELSGLIIAGFYEFGVDHQYNSTYSSLPISSLFGNFLTSFLDCRATEFDNSSST